jgi:hypothetical protein
MQRIDDFAKYIANTLMYDASKTKEVLYGYRYAVLEQPSFTKHGYHQVDVETRG